MSDLWLWWVKVSEETAQTRRGGAGQAFHRLRRLRRQLHLPSGSYGFPKGCDKTESALRPAKYLAMARPVATPGSATGIISLTNLAGPLVLQGQGARRRWAQPAWSPSAATVLLQLPR